jgi:hypothetical protein
MFTSGELQEEFGVCEFYHEDPYIEVEGSFHRLNSEAATPPNFHRLSGMGYSCELTCEQRRQVSI